MGKEFSIKKAFMRLLIALPFIYIVFGWCVGINYGTRPVTFGPYQDIPAVMKTHLLGSSLKEAFGTDALLMVVPPGQVKEDDKDSVSLKVHGYFVLPETWSFDFPPSYVKNNPYGWSKTFLLAGRYSQVACRQLKNPGKNIGILTIDQFSDYLKSTNRTKDLEKLKNYLFPARIEQKYPWLYSETVLLSSKMGHFFSEKMIPNDILGIVGLVILFIVYKTRIIWLWMYYLYWVFAYWFGRIGFHDPTLAFSSEGWQVILWSFWNGFILKEGRIFLFFALFLSVFLFAFWGYVYLTRHILPRTRRTREDFFKTDRDSEKRKELSVEDVEFKKLHYDISRKIKRYALTSKYFLGVSDDNRDVVVEEKTLTHHLHVLGPTGSGKTSLVILPLAKQAIEKGRGCCFIDFKGDEVFKKYVQQKAREKGKNFYYFSIDPNEASAGYNPLYSGDIHSKVDRIMSALELIYQGPASFYSNVQAMTFVLLLEEMVKAKKEINFQSVKYALQEQHFLKRAKVDEEEIRGLLAAISWIAGIEQINRMELDLSKVIKSGDIVFFALKSQINTRLAEAIGRMLIIDLKSQAVSRQETDPPYFIFIDEFQNLACTHFVDVISKVRSANFCLVLSNQSRGNLYNVSAAFENTVFTNTAAKIIFIQEDPLDAKFWSQKTGETRYEDKSVVQLDKANKEGASLELDGIRSAQGSIRNAAKNYISENIFLRLPFSKSIIFLRGELTCIANHEFLFDESKRNELLSAAFSFDKQSRNSRKGGM